MDPATDRKLSPAELESFDRRFSTAGYALTIEDKATVDGVSISGEMYGVRIDHEDGPRFDYRFRENETAVELLERILDERISEAQQEVDRHKAALDAAMGHHARTMKAKQA